jgi:hypothetical protein
MEPEYAHCKKTHFKKSSVEANSAFRIQQQGGHWQQRTMLKFIEEHQFQQVTVPGEVDQFCAGDTAR